MSVNRVALWLSSVAVVAAVLAGFVVSGSPMEQRLLRLDERRVSDLHHLARAFHAHWEGHRSLSDDLQGLVDGSRISRIPSDPSTGLAYEYEPREPGRYRLCARFDRPSIPETVPDFWAHDAGRQCFSFDLAADG